MREDRAWNRMSVFALVLLVLGGGGSIYGAISDPGAFFPAWLASLIFWLAIPLGALALVLVHDLSGGRWMATARPLLEGAVATMPLATIAFLPVLAGLGHLYSWSRPDHGDLSNTFYLNDVFFIIRYAVYFVIWNGLAAWALLAPRAGAAGVPRALSWVSAVGLVLLAYAVSFAAIDWVLSLEPRFWSSVFPMIFGAREFNASLSLVLFLVAWRGPPIPVQDGPYRGHMADLAAILLATTIFWAYVEFCQFLIIWMGNLRSEIPWYLRRIADGWGALAAAIAALGFFIPFFLLVWTPCKRNRGIVAAMAALIFLAHLLHAWWLVLPEFPESGFGWLDVAAMAALGGLWLLAFLSPLRYWRRRPQRVARPAEEASHG
jgi:hypothetical protein